MTPQTLPSAFELHPSMAIEAADSAAAELLRRVLDRAREVTLECVADFSDADARRGAEWGVNSAAWLLGHIAYSELRLCLHFAFGVLVDVGALKTFARGGAAPEPEQLPTRDALRALLADAHARVLALLDLVDQDDLDHEPSHPLPAFPNLPTRADVLLQSALHESQHAGQLMLLRKLLKKPEIARFA